VILAALIIIILHIFVRIAPIWSQRYRGSDAYYFLLTAEFLRKLKKLPLVLPDYYLLDITEQWYPPGFSVFLALIPPQFLRRYHWLVSPVLDLLNLILLLILVGNVTGSVAAVLIAGTTYVFTLTLLLEGINLNSRFLGNLQVTVALVSLELFLRYQQYWLLGLCLLAVMLILFTHKMAFQFLCLLAVLASIVYTTWLPLGLLLSAMVLALVFSRGYYLRILRGHYDIVIFWNKYWYALGSHQVYASPLYQDKQKETIQKNIPLARLNFWSGMKFLITHQPFILLVLMVIYLRRGNFTANDLSLSTIWFIAGVAVFLLTTYVNKLKLFGEGYKYLKFTAFPGAFLIGTALYRADSFAGWALLIIWAAAIAVLMIILTYKYRHGWFERDGSALHKDSREMIEYLRSHPELDNILCLPTNICDAIVYHARKHVLWGTHHYMFNERVQDFFPLLKYPLEFYVNKYKIQYFVINKNYADPKDLGLSSPLAEFGMWAVYNVRNMRSL
jgi:hypothetical protein